MKTNLTLTALLLTPLAPTAPTEAADTRLGRTLVGQSLQRGALYPRQAAHQPRQHIAAELGRLRVAYIPVTPTIKAHSINPVKEDGDLQHGQDGAVAYTSAHVVDYVEPELVVR